MRRYDDQVEVHRGPEEDPDQFLWRGRLWQVREVVAHWVETGAWWRAPRSRRRTGRAGGVAVLDGPPGTDGPERLDGPDDGDLLREQEVWRVTAARGREAARHAPADDPGFGVFDLAFSWSEGSGRCRTSHARGGVTMTTYAPAAPAFLPAATHAYLERAAASLREAITSTRAPERYAFAHVAALRATAALLAARARPETSPRRRQKNAWVLLAEVAPELGEWAAFFAAGADKRAAAEAGSRHAVAEREADDLVRDADRFLALVESALGLTEHLPIRVA